MAIQDEILTAIRGLGTQQVNLMDKFEELKTDVAGLKTDVAGLKTDVAGIKEQVGFNCKKLDTLQEDVSFIKKRLEGKKLDINP